MRPLGEFYSRQAMVAALPAAFVALWLALLPYHKATVEAVRVLQVLLPPFILLEVGAFLWPIWAFHRDMARQRDALTSEADKLVFRIMGTQEELNADSDPGKLKTLSDRLEVDLARFDALDHSPTGPLGRRIRRRFAVWNLVLVGVPIVSLLTDKESGLPDAVKALFPG